MKKLAARDFEDILQVCITSYRKFPVCGDRPLFGQCSIPVFEGLLPEPFNGMLLRLLYKAAEWHAFAKLRLHTETTLDLLEVVTKEFGYLMRQFHDKTLDKFKTVELPRGADARKGGSRSPKKKTLNLNTYKFHALADYVATIRLFGTTDSYSTLLVSLSLARLPNTKHLFAGRTGPSHAQTLVRFDKQTGCTRPSRVSVSPRESLRSA